MREKSERERKRAGEVVLVHKEDHFQRQTQRYENSAQVNCLIINIHWGFAFLHPIIICPPHSILLHNFLNCCLAVTSNILL